MSDPTLSVSPTTPPPWPFQTYSHPSGLWRIDYPKDLWRIEYEGGGIGLANFPKIRDRIDGGLAESVSLEAIPESGISGSVEVLRVWKDDQRGDLYEYAVRELERWHGDFMSSSELIFFHQTTVGGFPAYEANSTFTFKHLGDSDKSSTESYGMIEMWLFVEGQTFSISAWTPKDNWHDEKDLLKQIVYSFRPTVP